MRGSCSSESGFCFLHSDKLGDWPNRVFRTLYKEPWYKKGRVRIRLSSPSHMLPCDGLVEILPRVCLPLREYPVKSYVSDALSRQSHRLWTACQATAIVYCCIHSRTWLQFAYCTPSRGTKDARRRYWAPD